MRPPAGKVPIPGRSGFYFYPPRESVWEYRPSPWVWRGKIRRHAGWTFIYPDRRGRFNMASGNLSVSQIKRLIEENNKVL
jgi:hypothetical protein